MWRKSGQWKNAPTTQRPHCRKKETLINKCCVRFNKSIDHHTNKHITTIAGIMLLGKGQYLSNRPNVSLLRLVFTCPRTGNRSMTTSHAKKGLTCEIFRHKWQAYKLELSMLLYWICGIVQFNLKAAIVYSKLHAQKEKEASFNDGNFSVGAWYSPTNRHYWITKGAQMESLKSKRKRHSLQIACLF